MSSAFQVTLRVPKFISQVAEFSDPIDRDQFFDWLWGRFLNEGLVGVHEGTLLSEEAAEQGLETDSWTVDAAEAPRERDWVGGQDEILADLYFSTQEEAENAVIQLQKISQLKVIEIKAQEQRDWDAEWKASFLNQGRGVEILPFWRVVPPWVENSAYPAQDRLIRINPGAGFGTGTHEATQLCLQAIGEYSQKIQLQDQPALDFGSGSGILSIAMAQLGGRVDGVELDPLAIDNATENVSINHLSLKENVSGAIAFSPQLNAQSKTYHWVVANILRCVLIDFADRLVERLATSGERILILSGLIDTDVEPVVSTYSQKLGVPVTQVYEKGEWRALVFVLAG